MNVRKRSGKVVPFDAEFTHRTVTPAAAAGAHDPDGVGCITQAVQTRAKATRQEIMDIKRIQDAVEETLFERQFYRTAKACIRYGVQTEKEHASSQWKGSILAQNFLSPNKHAPNPM